MVRGIRSETPTDPEELSRYQARRKANNDAAKKHRDRTRSMLEECKELKKKYEKLKTEYENMKNELSRVQKENQHMIDFLSNEGFPLIRDRIQSGVITMNPADINASDNSSRDKSETSRIRTDTSFKPFNRSTLLNENITNYPPTSNSVPMEGITIPTSYSPENQQYTTHQPQTNTRYADLFAPKFPEQGDTTIPARNFFQNHPHPSHQQDRDERPTNVCFSRFPSRENKVENSPGTSPIEIFSNIGTSANSAQQKEQLATHQPQGGPTVPSPGPIPQYPQQQPSCGPNASLNASLSQQNPPIAVFICNPEQFVEMQKLIGNSVNTLTPTYQHLLPHVPANSGSQISSNFNYHPLISAFSSGINTT